MFVENLRARFFDRMLATPRGRAFVLSFLVGAEAGDEIGVFDRLLARVDDPELQRMVRRHYDDELDHAERFRACLARQDVDPASLPQPISMLPYIDRAVGGFWLDFVADRHGVMEAYLLLQVIEERGVEQYPILARAMAPYDPDSAQVILDIANEEVRHIRYAEAISGRYAPDAATLASTLARFRAAEQRGIDEHGRALLVQVVGAGLLAVRGLEAFAWRALAASAVLRGDPGFDNGKPRRVTRAGAAVDIASGLGEPGRAVAGG